MSQTPVTDLLRELLASGCPGDEILRQVRVMEIQLYADHYAVEWMQNRRAADRERKRKIRSGVAWEMLRAQVFARDGYACVYCESDVEPLHCDHAVPLARGGETVVSNLVTACAACNLLKGSRNVEEWRGAPVEMVPIKTVPPDLDGPTARAVATIEKRRAWDRERKRKQRQKSTGQGEPCISSLEKDSVSQVERKNPMDQFPVDLFGPLPQQADDWPQDFAEQFWLKWPRHFRKHSHKQVVAKLDRIREKKEASWNQIWAGLCAYIDSQPEHKFIPAPMVWLNQQRWMADYSKVDQPKPRKSFGDVFMGRG